MRAVYLTHPQVRIDPAVPVPLWGLSPIGRERVEAFIAKRAVPRGTMVFSSRETKALEMAEMIAAEAGTPVMADHLMGENDRSATGFLPPALFEETADRFFAEPHQSVDGWERAIDAQARIVATVTTAMASVPPGTQAIFCGHGAVGTLLKCHVGNRRISREEDQGRIGAPGGGNAFHFDFTARQLLTDWCPIEEVGADWFAEPALVAEPELG
jgi:broad specificity phosphatase PhoE